jgi:hypothetical protein
VIAGDTTAPRTVEIVRGVFRAREREKRRMARPEKGGENALSGLPVAVHGPILIGGRLVRMRTPERRQNGFQRGFLDDQFELPLRDAFHTPGLAQERLRAVERPELSDALGLPAAGIVGAETARPRFEEGLFDGFDVGTRDVDVKSEEMHGGAS